ncbi:hypothetical protein QBC47DRAFT_192803 [Echria macrotheca]|uniref:Peroxin 20 n=1 Tax=Echria macrotheca TaxID=438768 RepID=A0AAJ0BD48_9PEZI|nr:hypothetical protein QBC47DRAFT_192803 [Echria macrotheca]
MEGSLCGPSNGAKRLVSHVDRDRSLQQDRLVNGAAGPSQSFRSQPGAPAAANQSFAEFQQLHAHGLEEVAMMQAAPPTGLLHAVPRGPAPAPEAWVNEFSGMRLNDIRQGLSAPAIPFAGVHSQPAPAFQQHPAQAYTAHAAAPTHGFPQPMSIYNQYQPQALAQPLYNSQIPTAGPFIGMEALHLQQQAGMLAGGIDAETFNQAFAEFDETEFKEEVLKWAETSEQVDAAPVALETTEQEQMTTAEETATEQRRRGDEQLAQAASSIVDAMAADDSEKFKKSQFLELMRRIGNHEVVVDGPNFVDAATGEVVERAAETLEDKEAISPS